MKRILISLALGWLIIPLMLGLLFAVKLFSPNDYPSAFLWLLMWPLPILRLLCRITSLEVTTARVLVVSGVGDYLFLSFLAYLLLALRCRFLKRRVHMLPPAPPPEPVN